MKKRQSDPRIAIVHDNFRYKGGAERVIDAMVKIWPAADLYTSTVAWKKLGVLRSDVEKLHPRTSWAQYIPLFPEYPFLYRYMLPMLWRSFDFSGYDIVISSSYSQMSHLIYVPRHILHVCYSHGVPRHLHGYETDLDWEKYWFIRLSAGRLNTLLRFFDYAAAQRVHHFIASSHEVASRIKRFYNRSADIIYSPCVFTRSSPCIPKSKRPGRSFLVVSRFSRRKHIDTIIHACNKGKLPLVVAGFGPEEEYLKHIAGPSISFVGIAKDNLASLYENAIAVICAGKDEELGIAAIEAMYFGTPVIAYFSGGHKETVIEGKTGYFFHTLDPDDIQNAIKKLSRHPISPADCIHQAAQFHTAVFEKRMRAFIEKKYNEHTVS